MIYRKKSELWWNVYRAIFRELHHRDTNGREFSAAASRSADAACRILKIDIYAKEETIT